MASLETLFTGKTQTQTRAKRKQETAARSPPNKTQASSEPESASRPVRGKRKLVSSFYDTYTTSKGTSRTIKQQQELEKKYALLAHLKIPLGDHEEDHRNRMTILSELLSFQEEHEREKAAAANEEEFVDRKGKRTSTAPIDGAVKIVTRNSFVNHLVRIPSYQMSSSNRGKKHPKPMHFLETVMDCLFRRTNNISAEDCKNAAANEILYYMARYYNKQFVDNIEVAENVLNKCRKKLQPPSEKVKQRVIMHDGSDPQNDLNVRWNIMFQRLVDYREKYGDCHVYREEASIKRKREFQKELHSWIGHQRTGYKSKHPSLTAKRIELLEGVGFKWVVNPNLFYGVDSVEHQKAIAAKLCFGISAADAMVIAGFPVEEATRDTRKKLLNLHSCVLYRKNARRVSKLKPLVEQWIEKFYETEEQDLLDVLYEVYGESELLNQLYRAGKLVINPLHPSKRRRTDERLAEDGKSFVCPKIRESFSTKA